MKSNSGLPFSEATLARMQAHAVPLVDTIDSVVNKALDALEEKLNATRGHQTTNGSDEVEQFNPASPPSLKHAVPRGMSVDGVVLTKELYWNNLLLEVIRSASEKGNTGEAIRTVMQVPVQPGDHKGPGYRYIPEAGISFQQLNSDRAWAETYRLARRFSVRVFVRWIWLEKDKAHKPGATGEMTVE